MTEMFRMKTHPTATPREHARDFPAGHDDPQSPYFIPPPLRAYYDPACDLTPNELEQGQSAHAVYIARREHYAELDRKHDLPPGTSQAKANEEGRTFQTGDTLKRIRAFSADDHHISEHRARIAKASTALRVATRTAEIKKKMTCQICGTAGQHVAPRRSDGRESAPQAVSGERMAVRCCRECYDVLAYELAKRRAATTLPDGRTRRDVVSAFVDQHPDAV